MTKPEHKEHAEEVEKFESSPIDDVLEHTLSQPPEPTDEDTRAPTDKPLLGKVTEERSLDFPGRVLVKWRDQAGGMHERWLLRVKGLHPKAGDDVLLSKPGNFHGWVITGVIQHGTPEEEVKELDLEELEGKLDIKVDGRRVEIEGGDEILFKCGKASITLRRNGRVVIRGTRVETHSEGTNRIKGATVEIN